MIDPSTFNGRESSMVRRWHEAYRDLLDSWKMFSRRVEFDVGRQEAAAAFSDEEGGQRPGKAGAGRECPV